MVILSATFEIIHITKIRITLLCIDALKIVTALDGMSHELDQTKSISLMYATSES